YDVGDTLHGTATIQYQSGPGPLTNVTVTQSIVDSTGATVASNATTIATLNVGQTATTTFDWPVATTAPRTHTLKVTAGTFGQSSPTFTIRSTAQTGKGIIGTITAPATVNQGDPIAITATVANNGNADITNAPFAVTIGNDTLAFSASVAKEATFTAQLSE